MTESEYTEEQGVVILSIWEWNPWHFGTTLPSKVIPQTFPRMPSRVWGLRLGGKSEMNVKHDTFVATFSLAEWVWPHKTNTTNQGY